MTKCTHTHSASSLPLTSVRGETRCSSVVIMAEEEFEIDNELLIYLVQERPVLWDKTLDVFKDRIATRNAWHEVCLHLRHDFDKLEDSKKNSFGKYK